MRRVFAVALLMLLSGCLGHGASPSTHPPLASPVQGPAPSVPGNGTVQWASAQPLGDLAVRLGVDVGERNACSATMGEAAAETAAGVYSINLQEGRVDGTRFTLRSNGTGSSYAVWADLPPVHQGGDPFGQRGPAASQFTVTGDFSGQHNFTLLGRGLKAWDGLLGPDSIRFNLTCANPVRLTSFQSGPARLFGLATMDDGVSADVLRSPALAYSRVQGSVTLPVDRGTSHASLHASAAVLGRLLVQMPSGDHPYQLDGQGAAASLEDGPGTLRLQADAAGADDLFGALYGLSLGCPALASDGCPRTVE